MKLASALGWFSIGLGMAQLLAPRAMSRATGVADHPVLIRAIGARELAAGVGILSQRQPAGWLWSRVAGDAMDLALLGVAATAPGTRKKRVAAVSAAVAGVAALDMLTSLRHTRQQQVLKRSQVGAHAAESGIVDVEKSVIINLPPDACYAFWRQMEKFPRFMSHLASVEKISETRYHWAARGPVGAAVEWDADITVDQPGQLLAWHSLDGSAVENAGTVRFEAASGKRGTIVRVNLRYSPPGGKAGALIARLFGEEPTQQIDEDLRRFKWLIETGEIPTTVGQSSGKRGPVTRLLFRKGEPG